MIYRFFVPAILWALVILFATTIPANSIPQVLRLGIKSLDTLAHFLLFAIFGGLIAFAFYKQKFKPLLQRNYVLIALALGFLFGLLTEAVQHYVTLSRSGEVLDVISNFFGTIFGVIIFKGISSLGAKKNKKKFKKPFFIN